MNESEVLELFLIIENSYNGFSYDDVKVEVWRDLLHDVSPELAQKNLRKHIMDSNKPFPPTPGELSRLEPPPDQIALYHNFMKESAKSYIAESNSWKSTPPPDDIKAIFRLPEPERSEALKEYARVNRDRLLGEKAGT